MDRTELERLLRKWGHAHATRYCYARADRATHVLAKAKEQAPGTKENALRELIKRDGTSRRLYMAEKAGMSGEMIPVWAIEPIRAKNDADPPHDNPEIAVDQGIPEDLRWIDRALALVYRDSPVRALCVQVEYTEPGTQRHKAVVAAKRYGGKLSLWQYRRELQRGVDTIAGYSLKGKAKAA